MAKNYPDDDAPLRETTKAARGTKVVQDYPRDNSSCNVPTPHGKKLGGGPGNLSHSLSGTSAVVQDKSKSGAL